MSNQDQNDETRPLLERAPSPSDNNPVVTDDNAPEGESQRVTLSPLDLKIKRIIKAAIGLSILCILFNGIGGILANIGYSNYGVWERQINDRRAIVFVTSAFVLGFAFANHLSSQEHNASINLVNFLGSAFAAWVCISIACVDTGDKLYRGILECGNDQGCLVWDPFYETFVALYIVTTFLLGIDAIALTIATLIKVYRSRGLFPPNGALNMPGGISVEFAIRWGAPVAYRQIEVAQQPQAERQAT